MAIEQQGKAEGWSEYQKLILHELERLSLGLEKAQTALQEADAARERIEERTKSIDCATQRTEIATVKASIEQIWKSLSGKASWVQVGIVLGLFGALIVGIVGVVLKLKGG